MPKSFLPSAMLKGVGKWITLGVTMSAAVVGLLVNARNLGLTPWLSVQGISFADLSARRVTVSPAADSLFALGDTLLLSATVADQHGATIAGATLAWQTGDSAVAVVDSSGAVMARGPGTTAITVAVREYSARSRVTVRQRLARLAIASDSLVRLREGDEVHLDAVALDARGHAIRGLAPRWASSDRAVATVDSAGQVIAGGPGRTRVSATIEGRTDGVTVEVLLAPATVEIVSGRAQRGVAGRALPQAIIAQVLSRGGRLVPGIPVRFQPRDGLGTVQPAAAVTDRAGRARARWTLAAAPGRQRLLVSADGVDSTLAVEAEADPVAANTHIELMSDLPMGRVGERLSQDVRVRVTDAKRTAVTDVPVAWTALNGGSVEPLGVRTDSFGLAGARWTLGPRPGPQRLELHVGNPRTMPAYPVTGHAMSGWPAALTVVGGNGQRGPAGRALAQPVVVQVLDKAGNPIPDVPVFARARTGEMDDTTRATDATGRAAFRWTLGRAAGPQEAEFRAVGFPPVVRAGARALPLGAANIAFQAPPAAGSPGKVIPLAVLVSDEYGNPVPDAPVTFAAKSGALSVVRGMTDAQGKLATRWTLGPGTGDQQVSATVRGTKVLTTHTLSVSPVPLRRPRT